MASKEFLIDFVITFALTLVVSAIVTFLYSLTVHGAGLVDWETAFHFAIIFGILFPWLKAHERKEKVQEK